MAPGRSASSGGRTKAINSSSKSRKSSANTSGRSSKSGRKR
jgi:hypothetical protein